MSSGSAELMIQNGKIIPYADAVVHVLSPAVKYGLCVFEGLRAYKSSEFDKIFVFRLQEHTERLFQSMRLLRFIPEFDSDEINEKALELLSLSAIQETAHVRIAAYLDGEGEQQSRKPVSYSMVALERPRQAKNVDGIRCQTSAWMRISDTVMPPRIKCASNYVNGRLARLQAQLDGYDDAIQLNTAGKVAEAPGACLFIVRRGEIVTPDVTSGILESITRDTVIQIARHLGFVVCERPVERTELYAASEVFLVGSAAEILPVVDVDGMAVGASRRGPITEHLQQLYYAAVTGSFGQERGWLTAVPARSS